MCEEVMRERQIEIGVFPVAIEAKGQDTVDSLDLRALLAKECGGKVKKAETFFHARA